MTEKENNLKHTNLVSLSNEFARGEIYKYEYNGEDILNTVKIDEDSKKLVPDTWNYMEIRLFSLILSLYNPMNGNEDNRIVRVTLDEFMNFYNIDRHFQDEARTAFLTLKQKVSKISAKKDEKRVNLYLSIFDVVAEDEGDDVYAFRFLPELLPHIQNLRRNFVSFPISNFVGLCSCTNSARAPQLYIRLKSYENEKKVTISIDDIIRLFLLKNSRNLIEKVIEPCVEYINDNTDIFVTFEKTKGAKNKITGITFNVRRNTLEHVFKDKFLSFFRNYEKTYGLGEISLNVYSLIKKFNLDSEYGIKNVGALESRILIPLIKLFKYDASVEYVFKIQECAEDNEDLNSVDEYKIYSKLFFDVSKKKVQETDNIIYIKINDKEIKSFFNYGDSGIYSSYISSVVNKVDPMTESLLALYFNIVTSVEELDFTDDDVLEIMEHFKNNPYMSLFSKGEYKAFYDTSADAFYNIYEKFLLHKKSMNSKSKTAYKNYIIEMVRNYWRPRDNISMFD